MKFTPIHHQFSLFDYEQMRPQIKVPIKRISKERMEQAMKEFKSGEGNRLAGVLRDINDSLDIYCKKKGIK